jgi:hypothetical protein
LVGGLVYARIGNPGKATQYFEEILKSKKLKEDAIDGPTFLMRLAIGYIILAEHDTAVGLLRRVFGIPTSVNQQLLTLLPDFEQLRDHSGFQELLQSVRL